MNTNQLREAMRESISTFVQERKIIGNMKQTDKPEFRARLDVIENTIRTLEDFRNELPERGTVIIDSKGLTVVPFEIGDKVWCVTSHSSDCIGITVESIESGVWLIHGENWCFPLKRCFATREEAEAECRKRNG